MPNVKKMLVINLTDHPEIKDRFLDWMTYMGIHKSTLTNGYVKTFSEFKPKDFSMFSIEKYRIDQNYKGTIDQFIDEYNLDFEKWIIDQNINMTGIDEIIIEM